MEPPIWPAPYSVPGTLHYIPPNLSSFEPTPPTPTPPSPAQNTLLWIGGMFDTPLSISYPLTHLLPLLPPTWSLHLSSLSSSGKSWGVQTLATDVSDISKILSHLHTLRPPGGKTILMGHSTGCQDSMAYILSHATPKVDGIILQGPVSDREALLLDHPVEVVEEISGLAEGMVREGKGRDCLPVGLTRRAFGRMGITAERWLDVASPGPGHEGRDDFFSSDLGDERLRGSFGGLRGVGVLVMHMGRDTGVPGHVDKGALVRRWRGFVEEGGGWTDEVNCGVVEGASHNLNGDPEEVVADLARRVVGFVERVEKGGQGGESSSKI